MNYFHKESKGKRLAAIPPQSESKPFYDTFWKVGIYQLLHILPPVSVTCM
jgi:hypothetical protein